MAIFYSDQITKLDQTFPKVLVQANEFGGRKRVAHFTYKAPAASPPGVADVVQLARLPKGARVLAIFIQVEAMGGTCTIDIGDAVSTARYVAAHSLVAASSGFVTLKTDLTVPPAGGYGYENTIEATVQALINGSAFAVSKLLRGHIDYVSD